MSGNGLLSQRPDLPEPEIAVEPDGLPLIDSTLALARAVAADRVEVLRRRGRMSPRLTTDPVRARADAGRSAGQPDSGGAGAA
jgi:hypothetical protein